MKQLREDHFHVDGLEYVDSTPVETPVKFRGGLSADEKIRNMIRSERLAQLALSQGLETFEEADDFDVGDDYDPTSPYEETFDPDGVGSFDRLVVAPPSDDAEGAGGASQEASPPDPAADDNSTDSADE